MRAGIYAYKQILTGTMCHLEAAMVQNALEDWDLDSLDYLFIENVGNLLCPTACDLGESLRFVLLSVTEGEDKSLKYPTIFNSADVAVITRSDLAAAVEFDEALAPQYPSRAARQGNSETLGKDGGKHGRVPAVPRTPQAALTARRRTTKLLKSATYYLAFFHKRFTYFHRHSSYWRRPRSLESWSL